MSNNEAPSNDDGVLWTHERAPAGSGRGKVVGFAGARLRHHQLQCGGREQALDAQRARDDSDNEEGGEMESADDDPVPDVVDRGTTRLVRWRSLWLPLLLFMLVQCCFGSVVATDGKLDAILARLDRQEAIIEQQQATIQQQQKTIDRLHFHNLETKRDLAKLMDSPKAQRAATDQRRALSPSTCSEPGGARLQVDGVCSCADDVVIGNHSVSGSLGSLNRTLGQLESTVDSTVLTVDRTTTNVASVNSTMVEVAHAFERQQRVLAVLNDTLNELDAALQAQTSASDDVVARVVTTTPTCSASNRGELILLVRFSTHQFCVCSAQNSNYRFWEIGKANQYCQQ